MKKPQVNPRQTRQVCRAVLSMYEGLAPDEFKLRINEWVNTVPPELQASITFELGTEPASPYGEHESPKLLMQWSRPETDKEYDARVKKEEAAAKNNEARELKEFARLSKKFGPKKG